MANRLIHEQSPYLLQHAQNPVDWYPWGDEAFEKAKRENKPVIVSIGYAACHWCHVMERESFEDKEVAAYMNAHFVNIKVDREEHPDVDHLYMDAVQAISGSGGWPLNVFVTADRIPFYGGTYYPPRPAYNRPSWKQLLQRMNEIWVQQHDEVRSQSEQMLQYLKQASQIALGQNSNDLINFDSVRKMAKHLLNQADKRHGGFGNAPKFPATMAISFLLEHYHFTRNHEALKHALLSLDAMIDGGIYDQLGGGFARYSTDAQWFAPHFEKMLYDNALLILTLCDAYQLTANEKYRYAVAETIAFLDREMKDESGIYYSALDADSEGEEGKFYTWKSEEFKSIVDDELVAEYFGVIPEGNWEHTNILHVAKSKDEIAWANNISEEEADRRIRKGKKRLFAERNKRVRPLTDDKSLLSWNALMNLALTRAGVALNDAAYLIKAEAHMQLLLVHFQKENDLMHVWKNGEARITANLDDYAYLIQALLQLTSATGDLKLLFTAFKYCINAIENFAHEDGVFFYFTSSAQEHIPVRKVDVYDGATPSANAVMAHNLLLLGMCMEKTDWLERSAAMLRQMTETALRYTYSFGYWALILQRYAAGPKTIITTGEDARELHQQVQHYFLPQCYVLSSQKEISDIPIFEAKYFSGESLIFVCTQQACLPPAHSAEEILHLFQPIE